ncbi:MAG TPA: hypothetical protein VIY52_25945 [Streptosporangiaceae bacterium]
MNRRAAGHTRSQPTAGYSTAAGLREDPGQLVADRRTVREASTGPMRHASTGPMAAAEPPPEARAGHRRVGWRKGADVDEELWPVEGFGGVSDEQFWDDMASDKPLATTARTADPGSRSADPGSRSADSRSRTADSRSRRQPAEAYPLSGPSAADQTMVQLAVPSVQAAAAPPPVATQPYPVVTQPSPTATQPVRAARQPANPRGRRSAEAGGFSADEDPLTSPAYSLRAKGAVDGRSYLPSHRSRPDPLRSDPLGSGGYRTDPLRADGYRTDSRASSGTNPTPPYQLTSGSGGGYGGTAGYPYAEQPYSQPGSSANTPPYGDIYGYRNPADPAADPRQANGSRGHGRPGGSGAGDGTWGSRQAYPPVNGYRSPYDPRGNDRRLTILR